MLGSDDLGLARSVTASSRAAQGFGSLALMLLLLVSSSSAPVVASGSDLPDHESIRIDNDSQFDLSHGVSLGTGALDDPYVIQDIEIVDSSTPFFTGIAVRNTTAYVILRNITISNADIGIHIDNARNVVVSNCVLSNNEFAVAIRYSRDCSVLNSSFLDNGYAVSIYESREILVSGNTYIGNDVNNSLEVPTWVIAWFGALAIVGAMLLAILLVLIGGLGRLRRRPLLRILARAASCVVIQSLVIVLVTGYIVPEFNQGDMSWGMLAILTYAAVGSGVAAVVFVSVYGSRWVEPQLA